jgi:hypothetical protein
MKRAFLILLVIVCVGVAAWTGYLLFTHQTDPVMGWVIFAVDIGVLFWNISVLKAYRVRAGTVAAVFLVVAVIAMTVSAFAGIEPFAGLKTRILDGLGGLTGYDVEISPSQEVTNDNWAIKLNGGGWNGGTVTVKLTITNLGNRRCFGVCSLFEPGPELVAIDSTNKWVEPWVREPDITRLRVYFPPYTREFYPGESWTGTLKFEMSPYSENVALYIAHNSVIAHFLFVLGEPKR